MAMKKAARKQSAVQDVAVKELTLAYKRINGAPAKRLQWLLNLSEIDLDAISEGRLADLRWEIVAFGVKRKPEQLPYLSDYFYELNVLRLPIPINKQVPMREIENNFPKFSTEEELKRHHNAIIEEQTKGAYPWLIKAFQTTLKEIFDKLFSGEQWRFTLPAQEEAIALSHIKGEDGAGWADNPPAYSAEDLLLIHTIELLKAERARLRICQNPRCHKRFVAAKKGRAIFHSPKCSAYVRVNKARGKM